LAQLLKDGWRFPTKADFDTLVTSVGGSNNRLKIKEKWYCDVLGTNDYGFSAVCAGGYYPQFNYLGNSVIMWTSTKSNNTAYRFNVDSSYMSTGISSVKGCSVRLVRDVPATQSEDDGLSVLADNSEPSDLSDFSNIAEDDD